MFSLVPLTPTGFNITKQVEALNSSTTITFEWDQPPGNGPEAIVDKYLVFITPRPLSHPEMNFVTAPWNVTINYNLKYTATIKAINCAGESIPLLLPNIEYSKQKNNNNNNSSHNT